MPPDHFCLCISKTVRGTAMHFFVKDSEGYLSPYKVLSHLYSTENVSIMAWKPEDHFRKSAKSRVPDSKSPD